MNNKSSQESKMSTMSTMSTTSPMSTMESLAKSIADLYKVSQINSAKIGGQCPSCLNSDGILHENVSNMPGYKSIQIILVNAYNHYNKVEVSHSKSGDEEKKRLKAILPQLSLEAEKLQKLSNKDPENIQLQIEYKVKKTALDECLEKYGKLLTAHKEADGVNASKISDIKKAYKILIGYYDYHKKNKAVELYNLIKKSLMPQAKIISVHHNDDDEYDDMPAEFYEVPQPSPANDSWTTVPTKKNPFESMNSKKYGGNSFGNATVVAEPEITPAKLEELIKKYESKHYMSPANRKIVEDELAKRKAKEEAEKNAYPVLGNTSVKEIKFTGVSFKEMASSTKKKPTIPVVVQTVSEKKSGLKVVDMGPMPEPELVETIENGSFTTYVYKELEADADGNDVYFRFTVPNKLFRERMSRMNEEQKIYRQFLWDRENKPWCKWMSFDEWYDFQDEVAEQEELDRQREEEKYGGFCYDEEIDYDENEDYDDGEEVCDDWSDPHETQKVKREYAVESF